MTKTLERINPACIISMTGADRNKWLHSFCSNDIKSLDPGAGCEAFVLNVKGKTLCHAIVLANDTSLVLIAMGVPASSLMEHFDRYIIREDVQLADISATTTLYWSASRINNATGGGIWSHSLIEPGISSINASVTSDHDLMILVDNSARDAFADFAAANELDIADNCKTFEVSRVAAAWPINSIDLTLANLPQEFGRNRQAISFIKGCYLGQETVARLDAMGHVNQKLVVARSSASPEKLAAAELFVAGAPEKAIGRITSSALKAPGQTIALALVRVSALKDGANLQTAPGDTVQVSAPN